MMERTRRARIVYILAAVCLTAISSGVATEERGPVSDDRLCQIALDVDDLDAATRLCTRALEAKGDDPALALAVAVTHHMSQRPGPSMIALGQAAANDSKHERAYQQIFEAMQLHVNGNRDGAINRLSGIRDTQPGAWFALYYRATLRQYRGNKEPEILSELDRSIRLRPAFMAAYLARAIARANAGDRAGSGKDIDIVLGSDPYWPDPAFLKGEAALSSGDRTRGCLFLLRAATLGHPAARGAYDEKCAGWSVFAPLRHPLQGIPYSPLGSYILEGFIGVRAPAGWDARKGTIPETSVVRYLFTQRSEQLIHALWLEVHERTPANNPATLIAAAHVRYEARALQPEPQSAVFFPNNDTRAASGQGYTGTDSGGRPVAALVLDFPDENRVILAYIQVLPLVQIPAQEVPMLLLHNLNLLQMIHGISPERRTLARAAR